MSKPGAALAHADGDARTRVRWSSRRPFRRIAAILTSLALGAGIAVVGVAAPASAHTGDLKASAVCNTETGKYDVTYTLTLSNVPSGKTGTTKWRVGTTEFDGTPENANGMDRGPISTTGNKTITLGTEQLAGNTKNYGPWVYAYTTWNGATKGSDGQLKQKLAGDCGDETPDKVCDPLDTGHLSANGKKSLLITAPTGKLIAEVCVKAGSVKQGNGPEYTTVTPPSKTYTISHSSGKDISHYSVRYVDAPKPIAIPAEPTKVDKCGVANDRIVQPAETPGIVWTIGAVANNAATATAKTLPGFTFENGKTEQSWTLAFTDEPCPVEVAVPAKPAKIEACGVALDAVVEPKQLDGVTWSISPIVGGKATATATTKAGFVFADGTTTKTWDFEFDVEPCPLPAPIAPKFIEQCGLDGDGVEYPAAADHVTWTTVGDPKAGGLVTVTAVAAEGYAFPADAETSFTHTFTDEPCPPTIITFEGVPAKTDVCGADDDAVILPAASEHMSWHVSGDPKKGGLVTVTAVADKGYAFGEGVQTTFELNFDSAPCPTEIPAPPAPTSVDLCGVDMDKVNLPDNGAQVHWTSTGTPADGPVIVTATAQDGFVFPGGKQSITFEFTFKDTECIEPSLKGSVATGICEADSPWIFFDVELTDPDKQSTGNTASLVMTDGVNTETIELGDLEGGSLSGKVLWPGASVDENGTANGWPGWALVGDKWIEVDDNFAWTRGEITAELVVNPELDVAISYPPATPECATGPKSTPGGEGGVPAAGGTGLASTGFAGTSIAIVAGIIVIAGVAFLVVARIRRKRA
ncbi:MAG TPA: hypothetical protein VIP50_04885 [Agromyces sp.]